MLVITRKTNEGIIISDNIEITILEVSRDKVKVGIDAPKDIKVTRREIYQTQEANKEAAVKLPVNVIKQLLDSGNIKSKEERKD